MIEAVRFQLDENVSSHIAQGLRNRGIDVTTAHELGLVGATDLKQLNSAAETGRVLVTHDADFLRLHAEGVTHAGVAYCHQGSLTVGEMLRALILIHDALTGEEMVRRVEYL